ncbi:hypothetical protein EST38_g4499 [Candolleomyces aberdarensis]|uniref:GST N-terminal domain-containing protein n=1 Tax=Candolleomyces aberdarensis TaxID=2316362 RepID=A0A4Q2DMU2_9AGAR|nr:hypothetical protein EST38_g4499 [Candolleomyces aberdarensis]
MITFFDIPSTILNAWSLNTWRTRFALNYKGLPYKTEWVEYPDIAGKLKSHGIGPTAHYPDGSPYYSLPAIIDIDDATGEVRAAVANSFDIAKYLDEAYPDAPKLFPHGEDKAMERFVKEWPLNWAPLYIIAFKATYPKLNPASQPHFTVARAKDLQDLYPGKERLEDIPLSLEERAESWKKVKACFDVLEGKVKGTDDKGQWYLGDEISFADMVIGGLLVWLKAIFGEDSVEWRDIQKWNEGRWDKFLTGLKGYQNVD